MKNVFTAFAVAAFIAGPFAGPALAAKKLKCNSDSMHKVEMMMKEHAKDKKMVKMAMHENEMAVAAKAKGKKDECAMHLNMAAESFMKK